MKLVESSCSYLYVHMLMDNVSGNLGGSDRRKGVY